MCMQCWPVGQRLLGHRALPYRRPGEAADVRPTAVLVGRGAVRSERVGQSDPSTAGPPAQPVYNLPNLGDHLSIPYPSDPSPKLRVYILTYMPTYAPTEEGCRAARALLATAILPHRIVLLAAPSIHSSPPPSPLVRALIAATRLSRASNSMAYGRQAVQLQHPPLCLSTSSMCIRRWTDGANVQYRSTRVPNWNHPAFGCCRCLPTTMGYAVGGRTVRDTREILKSEPIGKKYQGYMRGGVYE